jgi:hypothetical protein
MGMITVYVPLAGAEAHGLLLEPDDVDDQVFALLDDPDRAVDIDKSWHGLHYLLTGSADPVEGPLGNAILGGTEVGDDAGYGPARVLSPAEVAATAAALAALDEGALSRRYDQDAMGAAGVYPSIWDAEAVEYLLDHYATLRELFATAAEAGHGMLIALT